MPTTEQNSKWQRIKLLNMAILSLQFIKGDMVENTETVTTRFKNVFTSICYYLYKHTPILKCDHREDLVESFQ